MSDEAIPEGWQIRPSRGFPDFVGPILMRRDEEGRLHYAFRVQEKHLNQRGDVHGGMLATFADQSLGMAVHQGIENRLAATIQLNIHYLAAAKRGDFIEARPELVRITRSVVFVRGELVVGERKLVAADGIWKILGEAQAPRRPA